jgi:hypothetical protein
MRSPQPRPSGDATVPPEAWDNTHPDHESWTGGRGWCFDRDCPDHTYGRPAPEPRYWGEHPAHPTCRDVTATDQTPRSEWICGPECPKET